MNQPLYKFIQSLDAIEPILEGWVKFTRIADLNDPSEMVPMTSRAEFRQSLESLRATGYVDADLPYLRAQGKILQMLAPKSQVIPVPETAEIANAYLASPAYDNFELMEAMLNWSVDTIKEGVGLFCLTARYDSLPMWAYYANQAHGFVVEYRDLDEVFQSKDVEVLGAIRPVIYPEVRGTVSFDPKSHENLFFSKYSDWAHEEEFRIVMALSDCVARETAVGTLYLRQIPKAHIARIICGWAMSQDNVAKTKSAVAALNDQVEVVQLTVDQARRNFGTKD